MKILVVEDDPGTRNAIETLLGLEGHEVRTAINGAAALTALETALPDAVLMDLYLPVMDGNRLIEVVRERWPSLPVLVLSAADGDQLDRLPLDVPVLRKPAELAHILQWLKHIHEEC